jgi:hypothetical protein
MTASDILFKIVIPLLSAFIGAVVAFQYQHRIELRREKRHVLQVLMMYRNVGAQELDYIKILNAIDVVYHNHSHIRELYHTFVAQTRPPFFDNRQWIETFYQMIFEMSIVCGYTSLTMHDIRDFYAPQALLHHYPNMNVGSEPSAPSSTDVKPSN